MSSENPTRQELFAALSREVRATICPHCMNPLPVSGERFVRRSTTYCSTRCLIYSSLEAAQRRDA